MAPRRSRLALLRAPFVITVAAAAASCDGDDPCPTTVPTENTGCDVQGECTYGDCYGTPTTTAECRGGRWAVQEVSCNPPPPTEWLCPVEAPAPNTHCNYLGPGCTYGDCTTPPALSASCEGRQWIVTSNCPGDAGSAGAGDGGDAGGAGAGDASAADAGDGGDAGSRTDAGDAGVRGDH